MTPAPPLVLPIFATPFVIVPLPAAQALNEALAARCHAMAASEPADATLSPSARCWVSRDDILSRPDPLFQSLREALLDGVCTAVSTLNDFTAEQFEALMVEARGWLTVVRPDGQVAATSYPMTSWLGVYCIAAPEPSATRFDSGVLRLYESRLGTMFSDATNAVLKMPFRTGHHAWTPAPGLLAVFPASALHEVATLRSSTPLMLATVRVRFTAPGQLGHAAW